MLVLVIYLISLLEGLINLLILVGVLGSAAWFLCSVFFFVCPYEDEKENFKVIAKKTKHSVWFIVAAVLLPSKDTAYQMLAAYGVQEAYVTATESGEVQRIASKSLKLIEATLDEHIKEEKSND